MIPPPLLRPTAGEGGGGRAGAGPALPERGPDLAAPAAPRVDGRRAPLLLFVVNVTWFFVSHRLPLAVAARRAGYDVHLAAAEDPTVRQVLDAGVQFHPLPLSRKARSPASEAATFRSIVRLYRRLRPDLVHHVTIKPVLYGGIAARITGVPAVVHAISGLGYNFIARGARAAAMRRVLTGTYRVALSHPNQTVIFQNPDDLEAFAGGGLVAESDTCLIRGSGVDPRVFFPVPRENPVPVVVLASRMLWDKGVGEFVEAAGELRRRGARARFVLVGDTDPGNPAAVPAAQLEAWRDEGTVEWWGWREDVERIFEQADVVCLPSYREGLPKVLLEAAASGLPIVTTDVPGCREVVAHGDNGFLVEVRSASALVEPLGALVADRGLRQRMGRRGRERAEQEFTLDRVIGETLQLYRARLQEASRRTDAADA